MKRLLFYAFIVMCSMCLIGCTKQKKEALKSVNLQILIDETGNKQIVVPNPEDLKDEMVVLPYLESLSNREDVCTVDLTFCGLPKAKVNGFEVGTITSTKTSLIHVRHDFSPDFQDKVKISEAAERNILGNCLVLFVSVEAADDMDDSHYIVVLDYVNKKSYITKTVVGIYGDWSPKLYLSDITGDGLDDVIVSNYRNVRNTGMVCEVFRFNSNALKSIYKSEERGGEDDIISRKSYFTGHLEDGYRMVIESSTVGFRKEISLLDMGYKADDLEIKKDSKESMVDRYSTCFYKNKKIIDTVNKVLYVSPVDDERGVQILNKANTKYGIRFMYRIYLPNHIDYVGEAYAYMNYNSNMDSLEITGATVNFVTSETVSR